MVTMSYLSHVLFWSLNLWRKDLCAGPFKTNQQSYVFCVESRETDNTLQLFWLLPFIWEVFGYIWIALENWGVKPVSKVKLLHNISMCQRTRREIILRFSYSNLCWEISYCSSQTPLRISPNHDHQRPFIGKKGYDTPMWPALTWA